MEVWVSHDIATEIRKRTQAALADFAAAEHKSLPLCQDELRGFLSLTRYQFKRKYYGLDGGEWSGRELILITLFTGSSIVFDYLCHAAGHINIALDEVEMMQAPSALCSLALNACSDAGNLASAVADKVSGDDEAKHMVLQQARALMRSALAIRNHPEIS